ncbi:mitochondrial import inner membrane translocase subunit Tim54 [Cryomyces antarcticus]
MPGMADKGALSSQSKAAGPAPGTAAKAPQGNPVFRMMGLPNLRLKLPSRNWMIFIGIAGSWTTALLYDKYEKRRIQKKWCDLVSHIALEPLPERAMPRKVTIFLSAPPGDGLRSARDHFHEYVKPVLVAAAMDWDVIEGRREGDVRAGLASRLRRLRKKNGEPTETPLEEDSQLAIEELRKASGITESGSIKGDIVIGRSTWKEYVRGLHEGWLGPLDPPASQVESTSDITGSEVPLPSEESSQHTPGHGSLGDVAVTAALSPAEDNSGSSSTSLGDTAISADGASPTAESTPAAPETTPEAEESKPKKPKQPSPFIATTAYSGAAVSPNIPTELGPSTIIPFPHILGFLNTPIRVYRFLTRRQLADDIGRQTAAAVLASYRPFHDPSQSLVVSDDARSAGFAGEEASSDDGSGSTWEQQGVLRNEEAEWPKDVRKRVRDGSESVWLDEIVIDPRIGQRMRRFEVAASEEARAQRIKEGKEGVLEQIAADEGASSA